jgi:hypothetical protein
MGSNTATVFLDGEGLRLVARNGSGHDVVMDTASGDTGPRPAADGDEHYGEVVATGPAERPDGLVRRTTAQSA